MGGVSRRNMEYCSYCNGKPFKRPVCNIDSITICYDYVAKDRLGSLNNLQRKCEFLLFITELGGHCQLFSLSQGSRPVGSGDALRNGGIF